MIDCYSVDYWQVCCDSPGCQAKAERALTRSKAVDKARAECWLVVGRGRESFCPEHKKNVWEGSVEARIEG